MLGLNYLAWLGILVWVVVPLAAGLVAWLMWRRSGALFNKAFSLAVGFAILSAPWLVSSGVKAHYDRQVRELCAKDGGVRVYETVGLPSERFNQWGQVNFYQPDQGENALGAEYVFKRETFYYKQGNPDLFRLSTQVSRRSDGKLLGESVFYKRGGGDLPGPWHGTSFMCPELSIKADVLRQIFVINRKE